MRKAFLSTLILLLSALPGFAQNEGPSMAIAGYKFLLGETVIVDEQDVGGILAAAATVKTKSNISRSGFLAGRTVHVAGTIDGNVSVAAGDVVLDGPVAGDASIMASTITVGEIGGNLSASGGKMTLTRLVMGYAVLSGEEARLESAVAGDLYINAQNVSFSDQARVQGRLVVFEETVGSLLIPDGIVPEDRLERRSVSEWDNAVATLTGPTWQSLLRTFLIGALIVVVLASLIAALMPKALAEMRSGLLGRPVRNLGYGFLAESVTIGSAIVLAIVLISVFSATLMGFLLIPLSLVIAIVVGFLGYVVAAYALGVRLLMLIGRPEPTGLGSRVLAAATGALAVRAIALIPFIGWPFALLLVLAGVGAVILKVFRPAFYVRANATSANIG